MSWEYSCPNCHAMLNPGPMVILIASREETRALVGFHPKVGKYDVFLPPEVTTEEGTKWDFSCPMCHHQLASGEDPDLCELELKLGNEQLRILFSRIAGEHATFIMHEGEVKEKHGEDVSRFTPFIEQMKYMRY
jgi:hypothetical protein